MFTQQHYEAIARMLNKEYNIEHTQTSLYKAIVERLITFFEADNANFKPDKFREVVYR